MAHRAVRQQRREQTRGRGRRRLQRPRISWWVVGAVGVVLIVIAMAVVGNRGQDADETNIMSPGPQQVGPVAASATKIDLGRVPLDRWVNPTFRLSNLGVESVAVTIPRQGVETLEGC